MPLKILGTSRDLRTNANIIYAQIPIREYLNLVGKSFDSYTIQRKKEKYKAYERLKKDIAEGTLLPPITLAVKANRVDDLSSLILRGDIPALERKLSAPGQVDILDGLQRTYIINELANESVNFKKEQNLLLEFWLEKELRHLIYRIIVLNAGRKPMSMRHQVELLFYIIKETIESHIAGVELYTERDETRRRGPKKYALDRIAMAYQCFLLKSHEVQRESIIAQELAEGEVLDSTEEVLNEQFSSFLEYLTHYTKLDEQGCRIYANEDTTRGIPTGASWFGSETTLNSFFAAVADFGSSEQRKQRIAKSLNRLLLQLEESAAGTDPFDLETLASLVKGFNTRKVNVGTATRRLYFTAFKEFFREEGEKNMKDCWMAATE